MHERAKLQLDHQFSLSLISFVSSSNEVLTILQNFVEVPHFSFKVL